MLGLFRFDDFGCLDLCFGFESLLLCCFDVRFWVSLFRLGVVVCLLRLVASLGFVWLLFGLGGCLFSVLLVCFFSGLCIRLVIGCLVVYW